MPPTVLIVASNPASAENLASPFQALSYKVTRASSGRQALVQVRRQSPEIILVDMPSVHIDPKRLARALRREGFPMLVFIAGVRSDIPDADVILPKTLSPRRIARKVRSAFENRPPDTVQVNGLVLDLARERVSRGTRTSALTPKEFRLLRLLMEQAGQVVTRKTLMKQVWDTDYLGDTRTLDVHIRWLRQKIEENPGRPKRLVTFRGEGYMLRKS